MKFLCLVHFAPDAFADLTPEQMRAVDDATIAHDHKLRRLGNLLIASPLADPATAVTIDRRQGVTLSVLDGPFAEAKEMVGGFLLLEAPDMAAAVALFDDDPILPFCRLEIRPLIEDHRHSETGDARPQFASI